MTATKSQFTPPPAGTHPFERAGLGRAPFRFIGMTREVYQACADAPMQPGAACEYCGQGIMYVCMIEDATGRKFKVGSDCVEKTYGHGSSIQNKAEQDRKRLEAEAKARRLAERVERAKAILIEHPRLLTDEPHPYAASNQSHWTLRDRVEWLFANAGARGRTQACQIVERAFGPRAQ